MVRYRQTREEIQVQEKLENEKFDAIRQSKHSNLYCDQRFHEEYQCFSNIISAKVRIIILYCYILEKNVYLI